MTTQASAVGALDLPIAAGTLADPLADPIVNGLLAFLGYWLKSELDAKLAIQSPTSADACPSANRFPYDPRGYWVRNPKPALYVWWKGPSEIADQTLVYAKRERDLGVWYVFEELVAPDGLTPRAGIAAAVDAVIAKACDRGYHPSFSYNGAGAGTPLAYALADKGLVGFEYRGGTAGWMVPVPDASARAGGAGTGYVQRGFPCVEGTIRVWERVLGPQPTDADTNRDALFTMALDDGDGREPVDLLGRYLVGPDGADPENE